MVTKPATSTAEQLSARDRLLAAADELFYQEGVRTVGIDRVIDRAGVAKATLYSTFGSKEALIGAYLAGRHEARKARLAEAMAAYDHPRDKLLSVFDVLAALATRPGFRGCAFLNAAAEAKPGSVVEDVTAEYRAWVRELFGSVAANLGVADPAALADQVMVLYDGATVGMRMDHTPGPALVARGVAAALIDLAVS